MFRLTIRDLLWLTMVLVTVSAQPLRAAEPAPRILIAGTKPFQAKVATFKLSPEKAREAAVTFEERIDSRSRCELRWCIDNEYVFIRHREKFGVPLEGIYVHRNTGRCRYVDREAARKLLGGRFRSGYVGRYEYTRMLKESGGMAGTE